jgi:hypothetical protein
MEKTDGIAMGINISALPPELRRRILDESGMKPAAPVRRRPQHVAAPARLTRVCSCRCEIFRPEGNYPERCDGCGRKWPT